MRLLIPPPIVAVLVGISMRLAARVFPFAVAIPYRVPIAYGLIAVAMGIVILAALRFRRVGTTVHPREPARATTLVTDGIFAYSRNPMYLALAIVLTAFAVGLANPISLLGVPLFVAYMTAFQIRPEEQALAAKFGAEYEDYRRKVRRWL